MITTIIFDFYGVFQLDPYANWLAKNGIKRTGQYDQLAVKLDTGEIDRQEFVDRLSKLSKLAVRFDDIYGEPTPIDSATVAIAQKLAPRYKLGLLSNASTELRKKISELGIENIFRSIVISAEVGLAKPNPLAFEVALNQLGAQAKETVFVDDNPSFVSASNSIGMNGILFRSSEELYSKLSGLGITID